MTHLRITSPIVAALPAGEAEPTRLAAPNEALSPTLPMTSDDLARVLALRTKRPLGEDDVREISRNLVGFFGVLIAWDEDARKTGESVPIDPAKKEVEAKENRRRVAAG